MDNRHSETPKEPGILDIADAFKKFCHRFFIPIGIPQPDKLRPNQMNITPQIAHTECIKEKCTLWNAEAKECHDVTAAKGLASLGEYAYAMRNNALIGGGD